MIAARQVSVRLGHDSALAVAGVDLDLAPGERVVLAGRSGAGKSSLALALAGLIAPAAGTVTIDGHPASARRARGEVAARVGLLFQSPGTQLLTTRVADEIALGLENLGWPPARIAERVAALLGLLGLGHLARRAPRTLSGGEMQRVALAAALAPGPRYLLLDEPTAHLDPRAAAEVEAAIAGEVARAGAMRLDLAPLLPAGGTAAARRSLVLERGRLVHDGRGPLAPALAAHLHGAEVPEGPEPLGALAPEPAGCRLRARDLEAGWPGGPAVVAALDLDLEPGTIIALSGPSGAGKSTLLLTLAGLLPPRSGTVEVAPAGAVRERVSCVFQLAEQLFYRPTVAEELLDYGASRQALPAALALVGLPAATLGRAPLRLSGGELRRVALAAGVAARRPVLLLDEPGVGLDGPGRRALARLVRSCAAAGSAVLLAAHDPELLALAGRRFVLAGGSLAEAEVSSPTPAIPL